MAGIADKKQVSVKGNVAWNTIGNIVYLGTQWLVTYIVVKVSGYDAAGILSLAMTIATTCSSIALYSMRTYQSSDLAGGYSNREYIRSRCLTIFLSFVVCFVFSVLNDYSINTLLCIFFYMGFKLTEALSDIYQGILQKEMRLDIAGINLVVRGVVSLLIFAILLVALKDLAIALFGLFISSYFLVILLDRMAASKLADLGGNIGHVMQLLKSCFPLAMHGFMLSVVGQIPRYFIEMVLGAEVLGIFTSVALPVVLIQALAGFMFSPLATPLADMLLNKDLQGFKKMVGKAAAVLVLFSVVAILLAMIFGGPLLKMLFGDSIMGFTYLVVPLVVCAILTATCWILTTVLVVLRKLMSMMWLSITSAFVVTVSCIPLLNLIGLNGAVYASIIGMCIFNAGSIGLIISKLNKLSEEKNC